MYKNWKFYNKYVTINVLQSNCMEMKMSYSEVFLGNIGAWHEAGNFILGKKGQEKKETGSVIGSTTEKVVTSRGVGLLMGS